MSNEWKDKNWEKRTCLLTSETRVKNCEGSCNFLLTRMCIWDDETIHKFMYNLSFFSKNILKSQNTLLTFLSGLFCFFSFQNNFLLRKMYCFFKMIPEYWMFWSIWRQSLRFLSFRNNKKVQYFFPTDYRLSTRQKKFSYSQSSPLGLL